MSIIRCPKRRSFRKATVIVKICVLASSSSGNATFIGTESTRLLVDAGLSRREVQSRLASIGEDIANLDAILITHEHTDHISSLTALARGRARKVPVYLSRLTSPTIDWNGFDPMVECFQAGSAFSVGDLAVQSFTIPHDAIDPVGFCFEAQGVKVGIAMDLGYVPDSVRYHLRDANLLVLESNHDLYMLKVGPYPWSVKQRVMGRKGHLSNDAVSEFILEGLDTSVETLILSHLSEHNNYPATAHLVASQALGLRGMFTTRLAIAEPGRPSEVFQFS